MEEVRKEGRRLPIRKERVNGDRSLASIDGQRHAGRQRVKARGSSQEVRESAGNVAAASLIADILSPSLLDVLSCLSRLGCRQVLAFFFFFLSVAFSLADGRQ